MKKVELSVKPFSFFPIWGLGRKASIALIRVSQEKCNCFTSKLQKGQLCENCIGDYHKVHGFFSCPQKIITTI